MGSSSFNLPNVERALTEMEGGIGGTTPFSMSVGSDARAKLPARAGPRSSTPGLTVPPLGSSTNRSQLGSPTVASSPSPSGGQQTQHEVLQNFFKSLLNTKDRGGAATTAGTGATPRPTSNGASSEETS